MLINRRIFDEITYIAPEKAHKAVNQMTDDDFILDVLEFKYPKEPKETDSDYEQRLYDELTVYPIIGVINDDSLLAQYLRNWHAAGNYTSLIDDIDYQHGAPMLTNKMYFLTCNSNYNVIDMDLFGGDGGGRKEVAFLKFINNKD